MYVFTDRHTKMILHIFLLSVVAVSVNSGEYCVAVTHIVKQDIFTGANFCEAWIFCLRRNLNFMNLHQIPAQSSWYEVPELPHHLQNSQ